MNKKLIILIVLCSVITIMVVSTCVGGGSKIKLTCDPVPVPNFTNDSIELNVYVENSGSMDAYMCAGSNLKDAVFDYVSDLSRMTTSCNLYYINSRVIQYNGDLESYIKDLTPTSFAKAGGDRSNTDLMKIIGTILKNQTPNSVTVFVSDCILDIPQNALDYLGQCQVSIKNSFIEAFKATPNLGVEIIKLDSKFEGFWFCGHNKEFLKDVKRPYYIWVIGDQKHLAMFNKNAPVEDIIGGIKEYCAYSVPQPIPFDIDKKTYVKNHSRKINVEILTNLRWSLQKNDLYKSVSQYKTTNPAQVSVVSVNEITDKTSSYSHVITLEIENPETVKNESVTFFYPSLPVWVANSDDTTGTNVKENIDKTTGLMALIKGVADAYKNNTTYGTISFELNNK